MKTKSAKVNKSQAIREHLASFPGAKVNDVVADLKKRGIKVVPNHVYNIQAELRKVKSKAARNGKPHRNGKVPTTTAVTFGPFIGPGTVATWTPDRVQGFNRCMPPSGVIEDSAVALIRRAKELAQDCGGYDKLKELVEVLAG